MSIIGTIAVNVVAKTSPFVRGMNDSIRSLKSFKQQSDVVAQSWTTAKRIIGAGITTLIAGSVVNSIKDTAERLDELGKVADKLGIKSEALGALRFGGEQAGVDADILDASLQKLIKNISEVAAEGKGAAAPALKELGLNAKELAGLTPDKMLERTADALQGVKSQSDKVRLSMDLFGKQGADMLNMLSGGAAGLRAMHDEAKALGIAIDRDTISQVEAMNDAMGRLSAALGGFKTQFAIDISPLATKAVDALTEAVKGIKILQDAARKGASGSGSVMGFAGRVFSGQTRLQKSITDWIVRRQISGGIATDAEGITQRELLSKYGALGVSRVVAMQPFRQSEMDTLVGNGNIAARREAERKSTQHLADMVWGSIVDKGKQAGDKGLQALQWLGEQRSKAEAYGQQFALANMFKVGGADIAEGERWLESVRKKQGKKPEDAAGTAMNEALKKGTVAAFTAERAGDRINRLLREQLVIAKKQADSLQEIAANTAASKDADDFWKMAG